LKYDLGVSIAVRKYPVTSRTWKSSSLAAKVVPGELGVRIARCTLLFLKAPSNIGAFFLELSINHHFRFIKRFFFLLIVYSLIRIGFYFYHLAIYRHFQPDEIFRSLLLGVRFDVAALCMLNLPILLLNLSPRFVLKFSVFERVLFVGLNAAGIIAAINDYELFLFMGKRLNLGFFVIAEDILQQLPQIMLNYWYFTSAGLGFLFGFYFFDKYFFKPKKHRASLAGMILSSFFMIGLVLIGIRGGIQGKSITVQSAFVQGKNELGHLVLNTPYHFIRTLKNSALSPLDFLPSDEVAINKILNARDFRAQRVVAKRDNIVLIIMESFSLEYLENGYMPFLNQLKEEGAFFSRHLANGRRSIEALPSLLCGLPGLIDDPISKSAFQSNKFTCLNDWLREAGYTSYFFHGGSKGTMGFDAYTLSHGFDRYYSKSDYGQHDFDGTWGIFDGPFLEFTSKEIDKMPAPFFAGFFSLSSHQPYAIPKEFTGKFPKGTLEIHESIGYADHALKKFFEISSSKPWFKDTLFIITADHTSRLETAKFQNLLGYFRVPLILYKEGHDWSGVNTRKVTQHADIPKSILDFVGLGDKEMPATSVSLFSSDPGMAMNYADGSNYFLVSEEHVTVLTREAVTSGFRYNWETGETQREAAAQEFLLKAYLQYFINGLIKNNLSIYQ
jgi:phosphoglycerol transferase MdoB-like AlkP superfamily enzyme